MMLPALMFGAAMAFAPGTSTHLHRCAALQQQQPAIAMMAKGFGTPKATSKSEKPKKQKSAGAVKRDKAAAAMDALKVCSHFLPRARTRDGVTELSCVFPAYPVQATGVPEYMVLIREVPEGEAPSKWYPVGGMAVPRSQSIDVSLSIAIFENEDDLLKGAFRSYPFLKKSQNKFEYGYRLKEFEDDPVKIAQKDATEPSDNPIMNWFNTLDNPLNDGSGWFNPLKGK